MARRAVMKESAKWRSGRDVDRVVRICAFGRGGKSAGAFSDHEGITAEDDGDVVVPADEGAALEVIEPQLALELLVSALDLPALLDRADDRLLAHAPTQRREEELRRLRLVLGPLDDEPERLAIARVRSVVMSDLHSPEAESRTLPS